MSANTAVRFLGFLVAFAALAAGCLPPPDRDDPIAQTKRMIEEAERSGRAGAAGNVLVRVECLRASAEDAAGVNALWRAASSGRVAVVSGKGWASAGIRVGAAGENFGAELTAFSRKARGFERTSEEILVASGRQGWLWAGRNVLVPVLRVRTPEGETVVLEQAQVGAQLAVRPTVLSDGSIELDLHPYFSVLAGPRAGQSLAVEAASTRVILAPGQKLVLGSTSSATADSAAAALFGYDSAGKQVVTLMTVTAEKL